MRRLSFYLSAALFLLSSYTISEAATRARFRAETVLNDPAVRISAGGRHSCQVNEDGTVRCWGANDVGQLGTGLKSTAPTRVPVLVSGLTTAVAVTAGGNHTCALLDGVLAGGTVRCWGNNPNGQLGEGITGQRLVPVAVSGLTNAIAIAAGSSHTCALLADGSVRCWGNNGGGQLGIGIFGGDRLVPVAVVGITTAVAITAGVQHTCALLANGTARCWGFNNFGQLGNGNKVSSSTSVAVSGLTTAIAIAAGTVHTCAVLADSTVRCWGNNSNGRLGDGTIVERLTPVAVIISPNTPLSTAVAITTGDGHTCALLDSGTAHCWGSNSNGQLGIGILGGNRLTSVQVASPLEVLGKAVVITAGSFHTCALLADGSAKCWGANQSGQLGISNTALNNTAATPVLGGGGSVTARDIAAGRNHTCAVRANGTVACWGDNSSGQLGDGTTTTRLSPVAVITSPNTPLTTVIAIAAGEAHTCALLAVGTVLCWGLNLNGQLGDGTTTTRLAPVGVGVLTSVVAIAAGGALGSSHTCALRANGTVQCWGANGSGQLGDGTTTTRLSPVLVRGGLANAVSIAVGELHTCALVAIGVPFCWGFNGSGRLGTSPTTNPLLPALVSLDNTVAIAGGNTHTCALRSDGIPFCWGANLLGQLGIGSTASRSVPTFVNLFNVVAIAGGFGHSCALLADGTGRCWGDNGAGQLGNSTVGTASLTPVTVGRLVGNLATFFSPLLGTVNLTTGRRHSCALLVSGGVACWGENTFGQLGINSTTNQVSPVSVPSFLLNIDPSVVLKRNGRASTVTILANCEAGQRLHVDVTLTQGTAVGHGVGSGKCTGGLEDYPVTVPAQGRDGFTAGPAQASAQALIRERGAVVDTQEWTRKVQIVSLADDDDDDDDNGDDDD